MLAPGMDRVYVQVVLNHEITDYSKRGRSLLLTSRILYDAHSLTLSTLVLFLLT